MNYAMNVTFQVVASDRAKAFVNEIDMGSVRIRDYKGKMRITFRCNSNPFQNFIRKNCFSFYYRSDATVTDILADENVVRELIPIVIRNFLRNTAFLARLHRPDAIIRAAA